MPPRSRIVALGVAAIALMHGNSSAQLDRGQYANGALGFRVAVPEDWSEIPIRIDENWIVAKFLSRKAWISKNKEFNEEHRPLMTVIVFTEDATRFKGWMEEKKGDTTFVGITTLPYRDYRDYLKRNLENGYFFEVEEEGELGDVKITRYEIAQHKAEPKRRLITTVYHGADMDVAVEFEVLEDRIDRLRKTCEQALSTFRFDDGGRLLSSGPTTGDTKTGRQHTNGLWMKFRDEWKKTPVAERTKIRREIEAERFAKIRAATPDSWTVSESAHFLVVTHADARYTQRMVDAVEAFRDWCDDNLGDISDEYVRKGVLRICADDAEYKAYQWKNSNDSWAVTVDDDREVVTYWDSYNGSSGRDVGVVFDDILEMYLSDIDPLALQYAPSWLRTGMHAYVTGAQMKGKKLEFRADDWEREDMRELERDDKLRTLQELMTLDEEAYWKELRNDRRVRSQLANAFRFIVGPGQKQKQLKTFLHDYLTAVIAVAEEHRAKWEAEDIAPDDAQSEAEEEKRETSRQEKWKARRAVIQTELAKKALAFDDRTWAKLNGTYEKFAKD